MDNLRFTALSIAMSGKEGIFAFPDKKASEYFGELTFNRAAIRERLTEEAYSQVINSIEKGEKIDRDRTSPFPFTGNKPELLIDDELWPLPKYRELLFTR